MPATFDLNELIRNLPQGEYESAPLGGPRVRVLPTGSKAGKSTTPARVS